MFNGALIAILFQGVAKQPENLVDINNVIGSLFIFMMQLFTSTNYPVMVTFGLEKPVFIREVQSKMYSLFSYYFAKNLIEIPLTFISPLVMQVIVYWAVGYQQNYIRFWMMYLVLVVMVFSATGLGFLIGATSNSVESSSAMATAFIMPILAFSGLVVNNSTLPVWFRWI